MNRLHLSDKDMVELRNKAKSDYHANVVEYHKGKADKALREYLYHEAMMNQAINTLEGRASQKFEIAAYVSDQEIHINYTERKHDKGVLVYTNDQELRKEGILPTIFSNVPTWGSRAKVYRNYKYVPTGTDKAHDCTETWFTNEPMKNASKIKNSF